LVINKLQIRIARIAYIVYTVRARLQSSRSCRSSLMLSCCGWCAALCSIDRHVDVTLYSTSYTIYCS